MVLRCGSSVEGNAHLFEEIKRAVFGNAGKKIAKNAENLSTSIGEQIHRKGFSNLVVGRLIG